MRFEPTFRSVRMRPADGPSNGSETLSRIRSLADYTIAMLESSFRKQQPFFLLFAFVQSRNLCHLRNERFDDLIDPFVDRHRFRSSAAGSAAPRLPSSGHTGS